MRRFDVATLEGDAIRAEVAARDTCEWAEDAGDLGNFMWFCCNLANALLALDRDDEAEQWLEHGREIAPSDERMSQMLWRQARSKLLARRGQLEEGERLACEAVSIAGETDMLNAHADALLDLADVLTLAGRDAQRSSRRHWRSTSARAISSWPTARDRDSRNSRLHREPASRSLHIAMGRAGMEPATLGSVS